MKLVRDLEDVIKYEHEMNSKTIWEGKIVGKILQDFYSLEFFFNLFKKAHDIFCG